MKREQLIRQLSKDAKAAGDELRMDMARGKGGHCVVRFKDSFSIIKSGEITPLMEKDYPQATGSAGLKGE
jgi:hypothetical protein